MRPWKSSLFLTGLVILILFALVTNTSAQRRSGKFRRASVPSCFFAVEIPMRPGMQLQLQYTFKETQLDWDQSGGVKERHADMTVNYGQIGGGLSVKF